MRKKVVVTHLEKQERTEGVTYGTCEIVRNGKDTFQLVFFEEVHPSSQKVRQERIQLQSSDFLPNSKAESPLL